MSALCRSRSSQALNGTSCGDSECFKLRLVDVSYQATFKQILGTKPVSHTYALSVAQLEIMRDTMIRQERGQDYRGILYQEISPLLQNE
jgi:hypothetical protein